MEAGQPLTVKIESVDTVQKRIALTPEDYTAKEQQQEREQEALPTVAKEPVSMGTFADLLKRQIKKK